MLIGWRWLLGWLLRFVARILSAITVMMMATARLDLGLTCSRFSVLFRSRTPYVHQSCHIANQQ
jgi:hypothetical protein